MDIRSADILAAAGLLGHGALLLLLVRRRLLSRLPVFTLLIAFYLLRSGLTLIPGFLAARPAMYWLLIYLDPGLQLLVIMSFGAWAWRVRKAVFLAVPFFLFFAGLLAWLIGPSSHYSAHNLALKLGVFVSALWLETTLTVWLMLRKSQPETIRLPLEIAFGFAAYSVINIVTEVLLMHYALSRRHGIVAGLFYLRVGVYLLCLGSWALLIWLSPHSVHEDMYQREAAGR